MAYKWNDTRERERKRAPQVTAKHGLKTKHGSYLKSIDEVLQREPLAWKRGSYIEPTNELIYKREKPNRNRQ